MNTSSSTMISADIQDSESQNSSAKKQNKNWDNYELKSIGNMNEHNASLFGRDITSIPCFRNSFLYGITSGIAAGIIYFGLTSKVASATKLGFWSYVGITSIYWTYCRYDYSVTKFQYEKLQHGLREYAIKEGTQDDPNLINCSK